MRVISGTARGTKLESLEGLSTRPTIDRVKEGIFSSIQFAVPAAKVLDLFAGSGQMGIEALSRGAERAVFVDSGKKPCDCIRQNLKELSLSDRAEVKMQNVESFLSLCSEKFDIIFLDPPYKEELVSAVFEAVTRVANDTAAIICEVPKGLEVLENVNGFSLKKRYRYGKTELVLFRKEDGQTEIY